MTYTVPPDDGIYFGFRHYKSDWRTDEIKEIATFEIAKDPSHYNYRRAFKLKRDGSRSSKSIPLHSEGLCLFKHKLSAQEYIERCIVQKEKKAQEFLERTKESIEYLQKVTF